MLRFWLRKRQKNWAKFYVVSDIESAPTLAPKIGKKFGRNSNVVRDIESAPILAPKKSQSLGKIPMG